MDGLQNSIVFRADAGPAIGSGHLMRCLALAQACKERGLTPCFLSSKLPEPLAGRLRDEDIPCHPLSSTPGSDADASEASALARDSGAAWIAIDGYHFPPEYQKSVSASGARVLVIDDCSHCPIYHADSLLNQNAGASPSMYPVKLPKFCDTLLGPSFALLRKEFKERAGLVPQRDFSSVRKVFLTLGGGANEDLLSCAIEALGMALPKDAEIVLVPGAAKLSGLDAAIRKSPVKVSVKGNPPDICSIMLGCDFAIIGGGSTTWEILFAGIPSIIVAFADNQKAVSKATEKLGAAIKSISKEELCDVSGFSKTLSKALNDAVLRRKVSEKARATVDGLGALRVADGLLSPRLRDATQSDCEFVFRLSNDPEVRKASFSSKPIEWESHVKWFGQAISSADSEFYIVESFKREPLGQVRFKVAPSGEATISVSLASESRGKGAGVRSIALSSEALFRARREVAAIHAFIKPENKASTAAFQKAGYAASPLPHDGTPEGSAHLTLRRPENT